MNARFYAPDAAAPGDVVALPDEEAQHLTRVLRLEAGDAVRVFNGRGDEFEAVVEEAARTASRVRIGARATAAPEPRVAVTLAQAVLKGDKMDDVVRDAVMMGVAAVQPLITARAEVTRAMLERGRRRERWQRIAVSSAKQCHRAVVPPILPACELADLPARLAGLQLPNPALMLVEPGAAPDVLPFGEIEATPPREVTLLIGPEGGWTPDEVRQGSDVCRLVRVGGRTLRADAMAVVAIAALFTRWQEF